MNKYQMRWFSFIFALTAMFSGLFFAVAAHARDKSDKELFSPDAKNEVYYVPQFSEFKEISEQERNFLKKILDRAAKDNVKAVIFELDTPGGSVDVAYKYVSIMAKSKVPVIAFLNPHGVSAGMIIAIASDRIAINPHGIIGDAMPIQISAGGIKPVTEEPEEPKEPETKKKEAQKDDKKKVEKTDKTKDKNKNKDKENDDETPVLEKILKEFQGVPKGYKPRKSPDADKTQKLADQKFLTVFFKELQVQAEKNDRPVKVIRAMADPYQRLSLKDDGIEHTKDSPLTLSAAEAKKLNVVDYVCRDRESLLRQLNLSDCKVVEIRKTPTEQVMSFLAHPALAGVLLILGIIGIYIEIKTPGFGVPGVLGLSALTLFFLGHMASGASDWGPMVIFFVGLGLLLIEIFVIPGFGLVGILGISCIAISFFAAFGLENIETAVNVVGISMLASIAIIIVLTIYVLPKSTMFRRITLSAQQNSSEGFSSFHEDESIVGRIGITLTKLRPTGTVCINDKRYDAMTEGDYIEKDEEVEVLKLNGFQIVVRKV
ncbi:MAG: NfeD family protein [Victivallaceae bacterium]